MNSKLLKFSLCLLLSILVINPSNACSDILVTKGASKDGSVMLTYAADSHTLYGEVYYKAASVYPIGAMLDIYEWDTGKLLGKIPQVRYTYQTVGNMNEHQVIITESTFGGRSELQDTTGVIDYGSLIYVTLQRAKTAREAIKIMADLTSKYGYYSSGESFSVGDKDEVWYMELIGKGMKMVDGKNVNKGMVWVATRIPDGYISAHANQARITKINFKDKKNWMYSKDVVSFAREMGYFEGEDEDFSFSDAYAPLDFGALRYCEARVWSVFNTLGGGMIGDKKAEEYLPYAMGDVTAERMPLFIKPAEKLSMKQVADMMRDSYEGTPMDMTQDVGAGMHGTPRRLMGLTWEYDGKTYFNERPLATMQTGWWILAQARNWLPKELAGVLWFGVDDAATSPLTPLYANTQEIPTCLKEGNGSMIEYSPTSLFWLNNRVANFAYLYYDLVSSEIRKAIDSHELSCLEEMKELESRAQKAENKKEVISMITDYTVDNTQDLFDTWVGLDILLLTKYVDGNVKKQNADGSLMNNGFAPNQPAFPSRPGYSKQWKQSVAEQTGDRYLLK